MFQRKNVFGAIAALAVGARLYFDGLSGSRYFSFDGVNLYYRGGNLIVPDGAMIASGGAQLGAGQSLYGWTTEATYIRGSMADGGTAVAVKLGSGTAWVNAAAKLVSITNNNVEKAYWDVNGNYAGAAVSCSYLAVNSNGTLHVNVGDSSGTPGNATINAPSGKSAVAAAANTIVVTNSTITASSKVFISPLDADTAVVKWKVVVATGSFTLTTYNAAGALTAAAAAWKFDWFVINS